jgi:hypothetical protein
MLVALFNAVKVESVPLNSISFLGSLVRPGAYGPVTHDGEDADDIDFVREDGSWKWCEP